MKVRCSSFGIALSTNRKNRVLRAPATSIHGKPLAHRSGAFSLANAKIRANSTTNSIRQLRSSGKKVLLVCLGADDYELCR
jgi:hypothetical protein